MQQVRAQLRERRRALGLNQTEVATALGVTHSALSRWESGDRDPSVAELEAWARAVGLRVEIVEPGCLDPRRAGLLSLFARVLPVLPDVLLDALAGMLKPYDAAREREG